MIVVDGKPHHTGTNVTDAEHEIPLSLFSVTCLNKDGSPSGHPDDQFEAVDEGDANAQYIKKYNLPVASTENAKGTSKLRFKTEVMKERRRDALNPPESKVKNASAPPQKKADKKSSSKKDD